MYRSEFVHTNLNSLSSNAVSSDLEVLQYIRMPHVAQPSQQMLSDRFLTSVGGSQSRLVLLILNYRLPPVTFALWKHGEML